jgi:hypothetical protein
MGVDRAMLAACRSRGGRRSGAKRLDRSTRFNADLLAFLREG